MLKEFYKDNWKTIWFLIMLLISIMIVAAVSKTTEAILLVDERPIDEEIHYNIEEAQEEIQYTNNLIAPVEPVIVYEEEKIEPRYGFTPYEIILLSRMVSGDKNIDGDGEYDIDFRECNEFDIYEVHKTLCVVMNRQRHHLWPNNVEDILLQKGQFAVFPRNLNANPSEKTKKIVYEWCNRYDNYDGYVHVVPEEHLYFCGNGKTNTTY